MDIEDQITRLMDEERVAEVLTRNPQLNFVQRILHPERYPSLDMGEGNTGTHYMAAGESDGKGVVYPRIVEMTPGVLQLLSEKEAWDYAKKNREMIEFPDPVEADWFSRNYKKVWGQ